MQKFSYQSIGDAIRMVLQSIQSAFWLVGNVSRLKMLDVILLIMIVVYLQTYCSNYINQFRSNFYAREFAATVFSHGI